MSNEKTAALRATLKAGSDYSAPWLTIDAETPDELSARLSAVTSSGVLQVFVEAANALKGAYNASPVLPGGQEAAVPQQQQPVQQAPQAPQQGGWGGQQQAPAPQQQSGGGGYNRGNVKTHPEGTGCDVCGEVLQWGMTRTNKGQWKCPQYRWNNGNPNEHTLVWA